MKRIFTFLFSLTTVGVFAQCSIGLTDQSISCNAASDGIITAAPAGGTIYTYLWSNSETTQNISGLTAGAYSVTMIADGACTVTESATVTEPAALSLITNYNQPTCTGGASDGEASVSASGGPSTSYTYAWNNASSNDTITDLMGGTYHITVTSGTCSAADSVVLASAMNMNYTVTASICEGETFNAGGSAQDTSGTYVDIYTTANGCDSVVTTDLTVYALPTATASVSDDSICEGDMVTLTATGPSGASFAWDNAGVLDNSAIAEPSATPADGVTTFNVTVSKNGCSTEASIDVYAVISPVVNVTQFVNTAECLDTLRINATTTATMFNWTTPYGTQSTSLLEKIILITNSAQTYSVVGVDDFGCASDEEVVNVGAGLACSLFQ